MKFSNYSEKTIDILRKTLKSKQIIITSCDKNVGFAIMNTNLYNNLALEHLNQNNQTYKKLETNPLIETISKIRNKISYLNNNNHISNELNNQIERGLTDCKIGKFKIMPKIHKTKFGIRPVISTIKHPTSILCLLIDLILQPIVVTRETYLKDSTNLIQDLEKINLDNIDMNKIVIYSMDFESLYTNIKSEDAINKITDFLSQNFKSHHIDNIGIFEILKLVFNNNIFEYNKNYYNQINGLIMGVICGPTIANLYLYILEINWYQIERPLMYKRYIDDICYINIGEVDLDKFTKIFDYLKLNIVKDKIVNFLDLNISTDTHTHKFKTSLYVKPTNTFQYLSPNSNHPIHIYKNIPKSLLIRNLRICSERSDFYFFSRKTINELQKRGFDYNSLKKSFAIVKNIDRNSVIKYKQKDTIQNDNSIRLIMQYDHNYMNLKNTTKKCFETIKKDYTWLNNMNLEFGNSILENLKAILIDKIKSYSLEHNKTKKCKNENCGICKYILEVSFLNINYNYSIPIMSNCNCENDNLVYIIKCMKCKYFYIGETGKSAKVRIGQHLNNIKNFQPYIKVKSEIAEHFNLKGHNTNSDFRFCIFKDHLYNKIDRTSAEADLMNIIRLFSKKDVLINSIRPSFSYIKALSFS